LFFAHLHLSRLRLSIPVELRHFANSYQIFFLHALGDLPSPFMFGLIAELIDMRWAMIITWSLLFPGLAFLAAAGVFALSNMRREIEQVQVVSLE
jgi:hypothetical protein